MGTDVYDLDAPKKPANLSVNADLLQKARELGINLSRVFEERLAEIVRAEGGKRWLSENREAIEAYNKRIVRDGMANEGLRRF